MVFSLPSLTPRPPVWQKTIKNTDFFSSDPFPKHKWWSSVCAKTRVPKQKKKVKINFMHLKLKNTTKENIIRKDRLDAPKIAKYTAS